MGRAALLIGGLVLLLSGCTAKFKRDFWQGWKEQEERNRCCSKCSAMLECKQKTNR